MSLRRTLARLAALRRKDPADGLEEEIAAHLAMLEDEARADGVDGQPARDAARRRFGNVTLSRERSQEAWRFPWLDDFAGDLRFGIRMLWRDRTISFVIFLVLAVAIGSATAIYSLVSASLLGFNQYPVVDRWDVVRAYLPDQRTYSNKFSIPELNDVGALRDVFEDVGAIGGRDYALTDGDSPETVEGTGVTADVIPATRVAPILGRTFRPDDDRPGSAPTVVLSYEFWQRKFDGSASALGRTIRLDGVDHTIIGVMPAHYGLWGGAVWLPMRLDRGATDRTARRFWVITVIRPGVSDAQVNARLKVLAANWIRDHGQAQPEYAGMVLSLWNVREAVIGFIRPALYVLLAAVGVLMLLACANVANLLLARALARSHEMTVRTTLGAGRGRLVRQMLTEGVILSGLGAVAGILGSIAILPLLVRLIPTEYMTTDADLIRVDARAVALATALALGSGLLFGLVPALRLSPARLLDSLRQRTSTGDPRARALQRVLMALEVALACVVATSAVLMIRSYQQVERIPLGFTPEGLLAGNVTLPRSKYATGAAMGTFYQRALDRLAATAGIDGAAATTFLPLGYRTVDITSFDFAIEGRPAENGRAPFNASFRLVTPGYFSVADTPIVRGRGIEPFDDAGHPPVAVINETMAKVFWGDGDPIGQRVRLGTRYGARDPLADAGGELTIVGVVRDSKQIRVIDAPVRQELYLPAFQYPGELRAMVLLVRDRSGDAAALAAGLRNAVRAVDAELPLSAVHPLSEIVADSFGPKRLTLVLLVFFASVGITLAAVGLYAIISFGVANRTREIGIRMAIGATSIEVLALVASDGVRVAAAGIAFGIGTALVVTRLMATQLYGVSTTDPIAFTGVAVLLLAVTLAACYPPARRATKVDPLVALRND